MGTSQQNVIFRRGYAGVDIFLFLKDMSLLSFWKDGTTRVWYIALILLLYALFPLIWDFFFL